MDISELARIAVRADERASRNHEDMRVVVETAQGGCPTRRMVEVKSVGMGFDWTHGLFLIHTAEPVVVVNVLDRRIADLAREELDKRKAAHVAVFPEGKYIAKSHEQAWLDGFRVGMLRHVTACEEVK